MLSWNVRGLYSDVKRAILKGVFQSVKGECLFIQETKMEVIEAQVVRSFCPWPDGQFVMSSLIGVAGGILLVWNSALWHKLDEYVGRFSVFVFV